MIKMIKSSLTVKICLLMALMLFAVSGITYALVAAFLPAFYTSQLDEDLDALAREMAGTIGAYESVEDADTVLGLFAAGAQVDVQLLDAEGNCVWPVVAVEAEASGVAEADVLSDQVISSVKMGQADACTGDGSQGESILYEEEPASDDSVSVMDGEIASVVEFNESPSYNFQVSQEGEGGITYISGGPVSSAVRHYEAEIGGKPYVMLVRGGMQPVDQAMEILRRILPYIMGLALLLAFLLAGLGSLYLTAPTVRLGRMAGRMAALDFSQHYQGSRTDELGMLGHSLNELSQNLSRTIGELQEANSRLRSDIEQERELERRRITFFSAVSHELKTPVTILKGHICGMLQGVGAYQDHGRYLRRAKRTVETMESMVGELLTIARMETGRCGDIPGGQGTNAAGGSGSAQASGVPVYLERKRTDLAEQLRLQLAELTELIEERDLMLCVNLPDHLFRVVQPGMMEKVFQNLLTNAIRYTPEGAGNQIRIVMAEGLAKNDGSRRLFCSIENTGVQIPPEALPHLFEPFYRVEASHSRRTGGSGLGLYIVRMALEQHGMQYGVENTRDGVRFYFRESED